MRAAADQEKRLPGRPRCAEADQAIINAVLALLGEGTTLEALSIEAVAARARVGKATIYRRWANKKALVTDAIAAFKPALPQMAGVSVREDLLTLLRVAGSVTCPTGDEAVLACLMPLLARGGNYYDIYQSVVEPRRQAMREVLQRGVDQGELRADLDIEITVAVLTAPVVLQKLARWNPGLDLTDMPERILDTVLRGAALS